MTWNTVENQRFANIAATPPAFTLRGGCYGITIHATFGTVTLQRLSADGSTFVTVLTAFTADGYQAINLPGGTYQLLVAGATGIYVDIVSIVTTM